MLSEVACPLVYEIHQKALSALDQVFTLLVIIADWCQPVPATYVLPRPGHPPDTYNRPIIWNRNLHIISNPQFSSMKVLILGASGFIGFPVAQALIRAGHHVIGVTRSETKAKQLATEEIVPIVGDVATSDAWIHVIESIDVVIDAVGGSANLPVVSQSILLAVSKAAQATRPSHAPKVTYIYTSGTWVHGENRNDIVSDTTPITSPADVVAWRPAQEQRVIEETTINGLVIRPSLLYGRGASLLATLFKSASEGRVVWAGTPGGRFALIHPDDLADLYVRATEKSSIVGGKIFDASNDFTESVDDFLAALVKVSGAQGPYEYVKPSNAYEVALATTSLVRPYLAKALLGWRPTKPGLVEGLPVYYAAWKATA